MTANNKASFITTEGTTVTVDIPALAQATRVAINTAAQDAFERVLGFRPSVNEFETWRARA